VPWFHFRRKGKGEKGEKKGGRMTLFFLLQRKEGRTGKGYKGAREKKGGGRYLHFLSYVPLIPIGMGGKQKGASREKKKEGKIIAFSLQSYQRKKRGGGEKDGGTLSSTLLKAVWEEGTAKKKKKQEKEKKKKEEKKRRSYITRCEGKGKGKGEEGRGLLFFPIFSGG